MTWKEKFNGLMNEFFKYELVAGKFIPLAVIRNVRINALSRY